MSLSEIGQIARSAIEVGLALANNSGEITNERANKALRRWEAELVKQAGAPLAESASFVVDDCDVSLAELQDAYREYQVYLTEPYPNQHSCRVRPTDDFQKGSFKVKTLPKSEGGKGGVQMIIGRPKGKTTTTAQAYHFPAGLYTAAEAKAWLKANDVTCSEFEAATGKQAEAEPCGCEEVIRKEGDEIILYDSEGEKVLQRFPFGEGKKYKTEAAAREAAKKREGQIQFFKHQGEMADILGEVADLIARVREMGEVRGSLLDTHYRVEDAFHAAFSPKDRWEGPYRVRDVFVDHPTLGDAIVVESRQDGRTCAVKFTDGEGGIQFAPRAEWQIVELVYVLKQPATQPEAEVESSGQAVGIARDATAEDTATLSEAEAAVVEAGRRAPVIIDFQVLTPGPGNKKDNHYYPAEVVERDIHVFAGVDVFTTDHKEPDRSERTKVGKVLACPTRFTEAKAPVAQVLIYDPHQAEKARNRADAKALDTLECSILGGGQARDGEVDGKKYKIVEAITAGRYLELVSKAGAGGKALSLAEAETGGENMESNEEAAPMGAAAPVEEVEIEEAHATENAGAAEPKPLEAGAVKEAVGKTGLPEFAKNALLARPYATDGELEEAIASAVAEVKKLTGSGQVTGLGESAAVTTEPPGEKDRVTKFNEIMAEVGLAPVPVPDK
jgi:hypothetical protein